MVVWTEVYAERSGDASRPEPEIARPEVETKPVENQSFSSVAAIGNRSQSVVEKSETHIEPLSGLTISGPTRTGNTHNVIHIPSPT